MQGDAGAQIRKHYASPAFHVGHGLDLNQRVRVSETRDLDERHGGEVFAYDSHPGLPEVATPFPVLRQAGHVDPHRRNAGHRGSGGLDNRPNVTQRLLPLVDEGVGRALLRLGVPAELTGNLDELRAGRQDDSVRPTGGARPTVWEDYLLLSQLTLSSCVDWVAAAAGWAAIRNGNGLGRKDADDAGVAVDLGDAAAHDVRQADFGAVALTLARRTAQLPHDLGDLHRT